VANDLAAAAPASLTVTFPRLVGGSPDGTSVAYPVTLASLNLPEFQGVVGFPGSALLHSTATAAAPAGGGAPTNDAELAALARQLAQDWYRHRLASHDVLYAGVAPWTPSGVTDVVEWSQTPTQVVTRARRGPWLDHREEVFHFAPGAASQPGAGGAPTPGSVTTTTPGGPVTGGGTVLYPPGTTVVYPPGSVTVQQGVVVTPQPAAVTLASSTYNNYTLPSAGVVNFNPTATGGVTITGLAAAFAGQQITLVNNGTVPLFFPNQDPGSSTPNQVRPPWGGALTIPPCGTAQLQAGKGPGLEWGVLNPGAMPIPWQKPSPVTTMGGDFNNFDPTGNSIVQLDPVGGNWNLTGIKPQFPGAQLTITVPATATGTVTLTDNDPASSIGNQLSLANNQNITLHPGESLDLTAGAGGDFGTTVNQNGPAAAAVGANYPGWVKVTKTFTDFAAASQNNTVTVYTLPARGVIHACLIKHTAAFTGGALTAYNLTTVQGGSTYFGGSGAYTLFQAPANVGQGKMQPFPQTGYGSLEDFGATKAITASLQSIGANLNAATAGSVNIYFLVSTLP
jgi:hypothetical protein